MCFFFIEETEASLYRCTQSCFLASVRENRKFEKLGHHKFKTDAKIIVNARQKRSAQTQHEEDIFIAIRHFVLTIRKIEILFEY